MKTFAALLTGTFLLSGVLSLAQTSTSANGQQAAPQGKKQTVNAVQQDPGEKKFQQNCNRCHNAPETLPPSATGTVLRHMRERANLSAKDEQDILKYLIP
jgi:cytochrome c5